MNAEASITVLVHATSAGRRFGCSLVLKPDETAG